MNGFIAVLKELGPIITAATPVLLIIVNYYVTKHQTRKINEHTTTAATASATGNFTALNAEKK